MKIVVDTSVPFIEGVFEPYATVEYKSSNEITPEVLSDADALICGTAFRCDASLLGNTSVRMIATASIGSDHIDFNWCNSAGVHVHCPKGCDANSMMNYIFSALYGVAARKSISLEGKTFGIIGVGSSGMRVYNVARYLGFKIMLNDIKPDDNIASELYFPLDELLENADIISLHVPLNERTRGMAGSAFFEKIKPGAIFINASRGEIVVEEALVSSIPKLGAVVIDSWAHEPYVKESLINMVDIATPHIAGFSYQAKQNLTASVVRSVSRFFGFSDLYEFFPASPVHSLDAVKLDLRGKSQGQIASEFQYNYPIFTDDFMFRMMPDGFDVLREKYNYRREFIVDF